MNRLGHTDVLLVALTTRSLPSEAKPLSAREVWTLLASHSIDELTRWSEGEGQPLASALSKRAQTLLQRSAAVAARLEQWESEGIWTLTATSPAYPAQLRERLGASAPAVLHGVGDPALLSREGLGVVGSRNITRDGLAACQVAGASAAERGRVLVSGGARGTDSEAMAAAARAGGSTTAILADALRQAIRRSDNRRLIIEDRLCLATPYNPDAGFSAATAMGRNKIIYGLSARVLVIAADHESGGTWSGAVEALRAGWTDVAAWTGPGAGPGNAGLVGQGARPVASLDELWNPPEHGMAPAAEQLHLDV